jgi:hypothetical protein
VLYERISNAGDEIFTSYLSNQALEGSAYRRLKKLKI